MVHLFPLSWCTAPEGNIARDTWERPFRRTTRKYYAILIDASLFLYLVYICTAFCPRKCREAGSTSRSLICDLHHP